FWQVPTLFLLPSLFFSIASIFFFTHPAPIYIYTLSLHDALPIFILHLGNLFLIVQLHFSKLFLILKSGVNHTSRGSKKSLLKCKIGRAVQQECRDRCRMPSSA